MRIPRRSNADPPQAEVLSNWDFHLDSLRIQLGWLQARHAREAQSLQEAEFQVFSQWGEDGAIQWLLQKVPVENDVFVEFGVADYSESNTRFLVVNNNWSGLIIDAGNAHLDFLTASQLRWRHQIEAMSAFIDRENINDLIEGAGFHGDIGLLSVDLDGNDYWILDAIEAISPRILVLEYNSVFGSEAAITIPYEPKFERFDAHYSGLYFGASLAALARLADSRGYALVGGGSAGVNAFFVRRDVLAGLREVPVADAYVRSRFRESRNPDGKLTYVTDHHHRLELIADMPVVDLATGSEATVGSILLSRG